MSDLPNFNNIYANLAESAYTGRPNNFPPGSYREKEKFYDYSTDSTYKHKSGEVSFTKGGTNLPEGLDVDGNKKEGIVYLQPDPTLKITDKTITTQVPKINGGYETQTYITGERQKGLLTDSDAGFNAYFVTDTPKLNKDTKKAYLAIRGSDAMSIDNLNDWVGNDANFVLTNSYIPQAKLANQALVEKIKEMKQKAPNASLDVTAHSLGTMVSAQSVAKLYHDDRDAFKTIGKVVLFDGPDVVKSLKNMGLSDKEIKAVGEKVTYFVNPFDMVSMLNRTAPYKEQFGTVNVIVPLNFSTTFDSATSSHDFGEFQIDAKGNPLVAREDFHPEMLTAGHKLAKLIDKTLSQVKDLGVKGLTSGVILTALSGGVGTLMALGMTAAEAKAIYDDFNKAYTGIVAEAKEKSKAWNNEHIPDYQNRIRSASGSQKVELRVELLQTVAQNAIFRSEDFVAEVKTKLTQTKEEIQKEITQGVQGISNMVHYLDYSEVSALLSDFNMQNFWDEGVEDSTNNEAKKYQTEIETFSATLMKVAQNIEQVDAQGALGFNNLMTQTQVNWGK